MQDEMRTKCEQVVMECLRKIFEIVVQSRVHFQPERGAKNTTPQRPRFNLHVDEVQFIRNFVNESRLYQPLTIDIFWDSQMHDARGGGAGEPPPHEACGNTGETLVLLERWVAHFEASAPGAAARCSREQLISQLRHVCKEIGVLLRCTYSHARILPAQQLFRRVAHARSSSMGYSIYGAGPGGGARGCVRGASPEGPSTQALRFGGDVARGVRDMAPIRTPFGVLTLTAEFRRDCSFGTGSSRTGGIGLLVDKIITDYVPRSSHAGSGGSGPPQIGRRHSTCEGQHASGSAAANGTPMYNSPAQDSGCGSTTRARAGTMPVDIPGLSGTQSISGTGTHAGGRDGPYGRSLPMGIVQPSRDCSSRVDGPRSLPRAAPAMIAYSSTPPQQRSLMSSSPDGTGYPRTAPPRHPQSRTRGPSFDGRPAFEASSPDTGLLRGSLERTTPHYSTSAPTTAHTFIHSYRSSSPSGATGSSGGESPSLVTSPPFSSSSFSGRVPAFSLGLPVLSSSPPFPVNSSRLQPNASSQFGSLPKESGFAGGFLASSSSSHAAHSGGWGVTGSSSDQHHAEPGTLDESAEDLPFAMPLTDSSVHSGSAVAPADARPERDDSLGQFAQMCQAAPPLQVFTAPAPPPMSSASELAYFRDMHARLVQ